ncbi:MAG: hypothetical protein OCC49_00895 [Fibrobacterales bacterium]
MFAITGGAVFDPSWPEVKGAFDRFVASMDGYDKTGILSFGRIQPRTNGPEWVDTIVDLTSDKYVLDSVLDNAGSILLGGYHPLLNALFYSYHMLKLQAGPKAVIALTSIQTVGRVNIHSFNELIDTASVYDIDTYMISTEGSIVDPVINSQDIIDSTLYISDSLGGTTFDVSTNIGQRLDSAFQEVRNRLNAQYSICYVTEDTIMNGDTYDIAVGIDLQTGVSHKDSSFWIEDNLSPVVTLSDSTENLLSENVPDNATLTVFVDVVDDGSVSEVLLFYRTTGTSTYTQTTMRLFGGDTYYTRIHPNSLSAPGLDFYIIAIDDKRLKGKSPRKHYPQIYPHHLSIGNTPATVTLNLDDCAGNNRAQVIGTVLDPEGSDKIVLHHKQFGESYFSNDTLSVTANTFSGYFEYHTMAPFFEYYLHSIDGAGGITRYPSTGELSDVGCTVQGSSSSNLTSSSVVSSSSIIVVSSSSVRQPLSSSLMSSSLITLSSSRYSSSSYIDPLSSKEPSSSQQVSSSLKGGLSSSLSLFNSSSTILNPIEVSSSVIADPQSSTVSVASSAGLQVSGAESGATEGKSSSSYTSGSSIPITVPQVSIVPIQIIADGTPFYVPELSSEYLTGTALEITSLVQDYTVSAWVFDSFGNYITNIELAVAEPPKERLQGKQYLYWGLTDGQDHKVATGVYIWKIKVKFGDGRVERFMAKTGVLRK